MKLPFYIVSFIILPLIADVANSAVKEQALEAIKKCRLSLGRTCPDNLFIKFHLYTRQNRGESQMVQVTETRDNFGKTLFNPDHPNQVIIHGFSPRAYKEALVSIKEAYLSREEANIWMIDWSRLAVGGACIMLSMRNIDHVAHCAAQLVYAINRHAPESSIHVVADRAGVRVAHSLAQMISPLRLDRITGLNPSWSTIPTEREDRRLNAYDADFVMTINTSPFLPKVEMFGQIDFYVNPNVVHQPGCEKLEIGKFTCDQRRALEYFAESITSKVKFLAWECSSYTNFILGVCNPSPTLEVMGEKCSPDASGIYITYTATDRPYALGHWEGKLYQDKGPKMRTDKVSMYSSAIKKKVELMDEKTPEIIKEFGLLDHLKSKLDDQTQHLKTTTMNIGLNGVKAIASHILKKKKLAELNENIVQELPDD